MNRSSSDILDGARKDLMAATLMVAALAMLPGCGEDARLADHAIPHVVVKTVTDNGIELGPNATPQQVAFVLLAAIRDDVLAGDDQVARRSALMRQFAVADPGYIHDFYKQVLGQQAVYSQDEWAYKKVHLWASTLAYYVDSFDLPFNTARSMMVVSPINPQEGWKGETIQVDFPASDPRGDPNAAAVVRIRMHKTTAGYWRVFHVGFSKQRAIPVRLSQPAPASGTAPPTGS